MFSHFLNKPYNKLHVVAMGLLFAIFFIEIRDYKWAIRRIKRAREATPEQKGAAMQAVAKKYPVIHYFYNWTSLPAKELLPKKGCFQAIVPYLLPVVALVLFYEAVMIAFPCQMDPFIWSTA
mmetsp:Transcript_4483/g.6699  ORF Transcript_4483/g.6699 Transcript_4483/m.6699 type:complete len:122 (+) Transcript_4483:2038-2403(+)